MIGWLDCAPPTEHRSEDRIDLLPDGRYHLAIGSAEFGNGTITVKFSQTVTGLQAGAFAFASAGAAEAASLQA